MRLTNKAKVHAKRLFPGFAWDVVLAKVEKIVELGEEQEQESAPSAGGRRMLTEAERSRVKRVHEDYGVIVEGEVVFCVFKVKK